MISLFCAFKSSELSYEVWLSKTYNRNLSADKLVVSNENKDLNEEKERLIHEVNFWKKKAINFEKKLIDTKEEFFFRKGT